MNPSRYLLAATLAFLALPASAIDVGGGKLHIDGNGGWAYARTNENLYFADSDGDYTTSYFDLALSARPAERLVINAQLGFDPGEVSLEWAFAEWRFSDAARMRIGQVKQPLGNFMELQFVGTVRSFYELPTSVYGPADVGATSFYGAGVTGELGLGEGWELAYDAYGGAIRLPVLEPYQALEPDADPAAPVEVEESLVENIAGGRLSLTTPVGVVLRLSGYGGLVRRDEGEGRPAFGVAGVSVLYRGERLWLSAEAFGMVEHDSERQLSGYAEAAWFLTEQLQVAARYEAARVTLDGYDGDSPLLRHDEVGLGLAYWVLPSFVLKGSIHRAEGKRFVLPEDGQATASSRTVLVMAGTQFTF